MSDLALAFRDLQAGRLDRAEAQCRGVLAAAPTHADALGLLAVICAQTGRLDEALGHSTKAIALHPADSRLLFNRAAIHMGLGQRDRAESDYREAGRLDSGNLPAHINLARLLIDDDRLDEAEACVVPLLESHPRAGETHECLG